MGYTVKGAVQLRGALACALIASLLALVFAHALAGVHGSLRSSSASPAASAQEGSVSLSSALAAPVSGALGASERAYWIGGSAGTLQAVSAPQRLRASFARSGLAVSSGALHVGLALRAAGFGATLRPLAPVAPRASANRVTYAHAGLQQWYLNGPAGLEQGFTLARAPSGTQAKGPLTLAIALSGDARASLRAGGQAIELAHGRSSLRYGGLEVSDANGRALRSWLALAGGEVLLRVDATGARYPLRIDPLIQQDEKLVAPSESGEGHFGYTVSLSGDGETALVGVPGDDGGVGGAWVFARSGSTWVKQGGELTGGEEIGEAHFGASVALSGDGDTALIGGPLDGEKGAAWVFVREGSSWVQQAKLTAEKESVEGHFGVSVALSEDGGTALVGGSRDDGSHGAAWVFSRSGTSWSEQGPSLTAGEPGEEAFFGHRVALSGDGDTALIGASGAEGYAGAAWVFTRSGETWNPTGTRLPAAEEVGEGRFGYSVALSSDGRTALVGGRADDENEGAAWVFVRSGEDWAQQGRKLTGGEQEEDHGEFGYSVALAGDGDTALIGGPRDHGRGEGEHVGAVWVFARAGEEWTQQGAKLTPGEGLEGYVHPWFGTSVALSFEGDVGLIGGPVDEARVGAVWTLLTSPQPRPAVTQVAPSEGPATGGQTVTIKGSGFVEGARVTIGEPATSVDVVSSGEIKAVTAPTPIGSYQVVVGDTNGISTGGPQYRYLASSSSGGGGGGGGGGGNGGGTGNNGNNGNSGSGGNGSSNSNSSNSSNNSNSGSSTPVTVIQLTSSGVLGAVSRALPAPVFEVSGNLTPVSGKVFVKLPGSSTFVALDEARQVPFGTIVNATNGKVALVTVGPTGKLQRIVFYGGEFKLIQKKDGLVVALLTGGDFSVCPTKRERVHIASASASSKHASGKHVVRKLWSEGHGSYATQGNYASGAVLGTKWLTEDLCDGTLIYVATDRVEVTNLVNHKHRKVKAHHSYLAKAP